MVNLTLIQVQERRLCKSSAKPPNQNGLGAASRRRARRRPVGSQLQSAAHQSDAALTPIPNHRQRATTNRKKFVIFTNIRKRADSPQPSILFSFRAVNTPCTSDGRGRLARELFRGFQIVQSNPEQKQKTKGDTDERKHGVVCKCSDMELAQSSGWLLMAVIQWPSGRSLKTRGRG